MRIAIISDAWLPQVNGVVRTLAKTVEILEHLGHEPTVIGPDRFRSFPLPSYPEIRVAIGARRGLAALLDEVAPHAVHVATEGPLGLAGRAWCRAHRRGFTTAYHTRFPEYLRLRLPVPESITYAYLRWFHGPATHTLVATESMRVELAHHGFAHLAHWGRGVDLDLFRPRPRDFLADPRPIFMYVGRVAVEKNLEAFLDAPLDGTKYVVGDGPALSDLRRNHPEVRYAGRRVGEDLSRHLAAADVMVFPSRTDTFGLVLLEAMACGVPVAAYPVPGPRDIVRNGENGYLDPELAVAARRALTVDPAGCRAFAEGFSWKRSAEEFLAALHVEQDKQVGHAEVGVPAGLAADPGTQAQVGLQERRDDRAHVGIDTDRR
jgi:glycosyltransferase involved in cell wall biosynthesis